jgi:hypothetical protein
MLSKSAQVVELWTMEDRAHEFELFDFELFDNA